MSTRKPKIMGPGKADDFQTPPWALDPLLPYLERFKKTHTIWEPACGKGNLVTALRSAGFEVEAGDILWGLDFFKTTSVPSNTVLVSNPPYSIKQRWIEHCYALGCPFAILMTLSALATAKRQAQWAKGLELLPMPRRVNFETPNPDGPRSCNWFDTAWFCHGILPAQLVFAR